MYAKSIFEPTLTLKVNVLILFLIFFYSTDIRRVGFLNRPRIKVIWHDFGLRCSCDKGDLIH